MILSAVMLLSSVALMTAAFIVATSPFEQVMSVIGGVTLIWVVLIHEKMMDDHP